MKILGQNFFPSGACVEQGGQRCPWGELTARTKPKSPLIWGSMSKKLRIHMTSNHQLNWDAQPFFKVGQKEEKGSATSVSRGTGEKRT